MLTISKWLLVISGVLLMLDAIAIIVGIPNPHPGWPLPCPITIFLLGGGILLFALGSKSFKKQ